MSKLSIHFQGYPGWARDWVMRTQPAYVKGIDPPRDNPFPDSGVKFIGRTYEPDRESIDRIWRGKDGAASWWAKWAPFYAERPWVHAWEAPNEPQPLWEQPFRQALDTFTAELVRIFRDNGKLLVGHNWGVGWADFGTMRDFSHSLHALKDNGMYLGLHEYCAPVMMMESTDGKRIWTLRYRLLFQELGFTLPTIIGECGIDGGVWTQWNNADANREKGWLHFVPPGTPAETWYIKQNLALYDAEIMKDDYIKAATIFTAGPAGQWQTFDVHQALAWQLSDYILTHPTPAPEPEKKLDIVSFLGRLPTHATRKYDTRPSASIKNVVLHHTAVVPKATDIKYMLYHHQAMARGHVGMGWPGIGYHYTISPDGVIYQVNADNAVAFHAGNANGSSIGIALLGRFDGDRQPPTDAALMSAIALLRHLNIRYNRNLKLIAHNEISQTLCPGQKKPDGTNKDWYKRLLGAT